MDENNSRIIWEKHNGRRKLYTKIETSKNQYRNWNPFSSKLGAALFNGLEIFPFESGSKIFYSDTTTDTTLNHISDIIGSNGKISIDKFNKNNEKFDIVCLEISYPKTLWPLLSTAKLTGRPNLPNPKNPIFISTFLTQ